MRQVKRHPPSRVVPPRKSSAGASRKAPSWLRHAPARLPREGRGARGVRGMRRRKIHLRLESDSEEEEVGGREGDV